MVFSSLNAFVKEAQGAPSPVRVFTSIAE